MGCAEAVEQPQQDLSGHKYIAPISGLVQVAPVVNAGLSVEYIRGVADIHHTGEFLLTGSEPVGIVQVWCSDGESWYQVPDLKITAGLVVFQCQAGFEWSGVIIN